MKRRRSQKLATTVVRLNFRFVSGWIWMPRAVSNPPFHAIFLQVLLGRQQKTSGAAVASLRAIAVSARGARAAGRVRVTAGAHVQGRELQPYTTAGPHGEQASVYTNIFRRPCTGVNM
jgi:hypothetical protein